MLRVPEKVLESPRRVEEAEEPPVAVRVVPLKESPEPTMSELMPPVLLPTRMPPSGVVDPVPPYI